MFRLCRFFRNSFLEKRRGSRDCRPASPFACIPGKVEANFVDFALYFGLTGLLDEAEVCVIGIVIGARDRNYFSKAYRIYQKFSEYGQSNH